MAGQCSKNLAVRNGPIEAFKRVLHHRVIQRQEFLNSGLPVTVDYGGERGTQVGKRINGIELAGLDERGDGDLLRRRWTEPTARAQY